IAVAPRRGTISPGKTVKIDELPDEFPESVAQRHIRPRSTAKRRGFGRRSQRTKRMRSSWLKALPTTLSFISLLAVPAIAQTQSAESDSRQAIVEQAQATKSASLKPYELGTFERVMTRIENGLINSVTGWHPFFENSYRGGGFAPGVGYSRHVSAYS